MQQMTTQTSRVIQVLELVLQNPSIGLDAVTLCSLLCSSKAVRAAAQQAGRPCTSMCLKGDASEWQVASRVASFARWLPAHAHLAGNIALELELQPPPPDGDDKEAAHHVLDTLLAFSMQQITAASNISSSGSTAAAGTSQQQQQQQRPPFALRSFSSSVMHGTELLRALPAATLTSLTCVVLDGYRDDRSSVPAAALAGLTNLRCLHLNQHVSGAWLAAVQALSQLTSLQIWGVSCYLPQLRQLPPSLESLEVHDFDVIIDSNDEGSADEAEGNGGRAQQLPQQQQLDLSHLARLTHLALLNLHRPHDDLQLTGKLPPQLLQLAASAALANDDDVGGCAVLPLLGGVGALQQLQCLWLTECCETGAGLLALSGLKALSYLNLQYTAPLGEVRTSSAWAALPQLHSLRVCSTGSVPADDVSAQSFRQVMVGVAAATSLQRLELDFSDGVAAYGMRPKLFGYLTGLRQLQELRVDAVPCPHYGWELDADDALHLTALTGLTELDLRGWAVSDVAAVAVACSLPELRILKLFECNLRSRAALPAIGKLAHLQHLDLRHNGFGGDDCLQLLTQLRALTCLELMSRDGEEPSQQQLDAFWAAVRGQQQEAQPQ